MYDINPLKKCKITKHKRFKHRRKCCAAIWNLFSDYSERSTIHGIRYLGEKRRHWTERIWWLISFVISTVVCAALIYKIYWRWMYAPVIITFADEATPISNIPFPTITICRSVKVQRNFLNYSAIHSQLSENDFKNVDLSDEEVYQVNSLANYCRPPTFLGEYMDFKNITFNRNAIPYMEGLLPKLFNELQMCNLAVDEVPCNEIFTKTLTDDGLCYTFNHMDSSQIYNEDLLANDFPKLERFNLTYLHLVDFSINRTYEVRNLTYPYRLLNSGKGLEFAIQWFSNDDVEILCADIVEGFKIHIHSAAQVPRLKKHFYHVPLNHDVRLMVRPNLMTTDKDLIENYNSTQRKCIADNEHNLVFFKAYTQTNCHLEALVLETIKICGCALIWMPQFNDTKVCKYDKEFYCAYRVEDSIHNANLTAKCLPACNSITYDAEISMSRIDQNLLDQITEDKANLKVGRIAISFKNEQYFSLRRSELYGRNDFIAGCGGILSLFMGVSILSIVEILYSVTIRLYYNLRSRNLAKKQIEKVESVDCEQ